MWIINRFCNFQENKRKIKRLDKMSVVFESHFWHVYCLQSECVENDTVLWYTCTVLFIISSGFFLSGVVYVENITSLPRPCGDESYNEHPEHDELHVYSFCSINNGIDPNPWGRTAELLLARGLTS